jgi:hypothetical protein
MGPPNAPDPLFAGKVHLGDLLWLPAWLQVAIGMVVVFGLLFGITDIVRAYRQSREDRRRSERG